MNSLTQFFETFFSNLAALDINKLTNFSYLTEARPESFTFSGLFTLLIILDLVVVGVLFIMLKRRVLVLMGKRKLILKKAIKYNFIFSLIWLVFIIMRYQGVLYLSMRLWHLLFLILLVLGNGILAISFLRAKKVEEEKVSGNKGFNYYQDYLPKKNKKRKH